METSEQSLPPYYILVSHSSVDDAVPGAPSSNFSHPVIQYQYRDDSTIPFLPQHPDEHVLVLDYDPSPRFSTVRNISGKVVVTDLKVDEAPGAAAADGKNSHMFVIETTSDDHVHSSSVTARSPKSILAQFQHRNHILRRVLAYPESSHESEVDEPASEPASEPTTAPPNDIQLPDPSHS